MLEAQEALVQLKIVTYPNMSSSDRQKTHRAFHKAAYPKTHESTEKLTTEQLASRIAAVIHGK